MQISLGSMGPTTSPDDAIPTTTTWRNLLLALAVALFTFGSAWIALQDTRFGVPPDEWAHATYVHEVAAGGHVVPDYAGSRLLPDGARGNYLNHPPLYYSVLGLTGRVLGWDAVRDHRAFRALSAAMVALGMMLWMLAGRGLGIPIPWLVAIAAATNAIPMFGFLAGSINNDNMAYLGVAIAFYGLVQLRYWPRLAPYVGALGVLVVFLTKATAALFLCVFFLMWALPQIRQPSSPLRNRHLLVGMAIVAAISAAYYLFAVYTYGSPFPKAAILYPANPPADPLSLWAFANEFTRQMVGRLSTITSHASLSPIQGHLQTLFWVMLLSPLLAWLSSALRDRRTADARMANAFMLALAACVLAHILVVWNSHLTAGVLSGMQPRYYGYALPGLFIFGFLRCRDSFHGKALFGAFTLAAALLLAVGPSLTTRLQVRAQYIATMAAARNDTISYPAVSDASPVDARFNLGNGSAGHLDEVVVTGSTARLRGWAANKVDLTPSRGILVMVGDQILGIAQTGKPRPDVAKAFDSEHLSRSGFQFTIDKLPDGTSACDIQLLAEQSDGSMVRLRYGSCASPTP